MEKGMTEITDIVFSEGNEEREGKEEEIVAAAAAKKESGEEEKISGDDSISTSPEDKNGGVFSNLILVFCIRVEMGMRGVAASTAEDEGESGGAGDGGGGGLIENIVSHLPAPLDEDAAPATEEASIFVHAIVHD